MLHWMFLINIIRVLYTDTYYYIYYYINHYGRVIIFKINIL